MEFIIQSVSIVQPSGVNLHGNHRLQIINSTHIWSFAAFTRLQWVLMPNHLLFFLMKLNFLLLILNCFLLNPSWLMINGEERGWIKLIYRGMLVFIYSHSLIPLKYKEDVYLFFRVVFKFELFFKKKSGRVGIKQNTNCFKGTRKSRLY